MCQNHTQYSRAEKRQAFIGSRAFSESMAATSCFLLLLLTFSVCSRQINGVGVGINYGQIANNLPSAQRVSSLLKSLNISRVKLYDADPRVLTSFSNSGVDFIIGIGNEYLANMTDPAKAQAWIVQHVQPHLPQTKISLIMVGNEVFPTTDAALLANLVPAMKSVYAALVTLGLQAQVAVTTAHSLNILGSSYPPSAGAFNEAFVPHLRQLLSFHSEVRSPFLINAYPYFAYKADPARISLEYVLFEPNAGMVDPATNLHYDNMLYAQIDAVYAAIKALGYSDVEVRISETGWPSKGDGDEAGANPQYAGIYNRNLLKRIEERQGTPAKPDVPLDIFVFALFNENLKTGPASERNYGLFYPNGSSVYNIGVQGYLPELTISASSTTQIFSFFSLLLLVASCLL